MHIVGVFMHCHYSRLNASHYPTIDVACCICFCGASMVCLKWKIIQVYVPSNLRSQFCVKEKCVFTKEM